MYSRSPSRNHRPKGFKVKHILQICVLVAVCFWLIYQVKHSHEKRKEFDEKDAKLASETESGGEILKLGRKDISVTEIGMHDKLHGEDDEDNEADEENRHEEDEQEREASRTGDRDEEEDAGEGDDEIDKLGEEKSADENHEEFVDEEKEREEGDEKNEDNDDGGKEDNDSGGKEDNEEGGKEDNGDSEKEGNDNGGKEDNEEVETALADQDEGGARNTHEAREEHYKADDASSEVAHDTRTIIPDTKNATIKHTNGNSDLITDRKENVSQSSSQPLLEENSHEATEGINSSYSRVLGSNEYKDNLTMSEYSSSENSTILRESTDQSQASNNLSQFKSEQSNNMTQADNTTYEDSHSEGSKTPMSLFLQANTSDLASDKNQLDIETVTNFTQHVNTTSEGSLVSSGEVKSENTTGATETKADDVNSINAGTNESTGSNSENNATVGENESSVSDTSNDNAGTDLYDSNDDIDSSLTQEEKDYRTDLGTLPDIKVEAQSADYVEAE